MNYFNFTWDLSFGSYGSTYHRGDGTTNTPEDIIWVDNEESPMRTNLGNILYFNTNEAT